MLCSYSVKYIDGVKNESDVLLSLACVNSETHNLPRVFVVFRTQKGVIVTGVPCVDLGNWD